MLLREYKESDANIILSWIKNEKELIFQQLITKIDVCNFQSYVNYYRNNGNIIIHIENFF